MRILEASVTFGLAMLVMALAALWAISPPSSELSEHVGFPVLVLVVAVGCLLVAAGFEVNLGLSGIELEPGFMSRLWMIAAGVVAVPLGFGAVLLAAAAARPWGYEPLDMAAPWVSLPLTGVVVAGLLRVAVHYRRLLAPRS